MSNDGGQVKWTEEQWAMVRQVVHEEATRTRVGASFLPLFGPMPADTVTVTMPHLVEKSQLPQARGEESKRIEVNDYHTKPLITIAVEAYLSSAQMADPSLSSALLELRRAANIVSRVEDWIVFNGKGRIYQPEDLEEGLESSLLAARALTNAIKDDDKRAEADKALKAFELAVSAVGTKLGGVVPASTPRVENGIDVKPHIFEVRPPNWSYRGLIDVDDDMTVPIDPLRGESLVSGVVQAIGLLEENGHLGPFACVLSNTLYNTANTPNANSMVLPSDRITPFLTGPLLRCGVIPANEGVVVSLAGAPVELVVAQDITVNFLQVNTEPRWIFRVSERIVLRIKERRAVVRLGPAGGARTQPPADELPKAVAASLKKLKSGPVNL